jgi:P4 family phage/plasmid primase-like protien
MKAKNAALELLVRQHELPAALAGQNLEAQGFSLSTVQDTMPYSDVAMAELLKEHYGQMLTYIPVERRWYVWNGIIHEPVDKLGDDSIFSRSLATDVSYAMREALAFTKEQALVQLQTVMINNNTVTPQKQYEDTFKKHRKYRDDLFMTKGLSSLIKQLELVFSAPEDTFTNDQRWLVVKNGVFDLWEIEETVRGLKEGEPFPVPVPKPHDPERAVARNIEASWDPGAPRDAWRKFLVSSIPDEGTREYLQVLTGAAFAGWDKPKTIPNLQGPQDSGKTVFVKTLARLGSGGMKYAAEMTPSVLMADQSSQYERSDLRGLRFVAMSEPSTSDKLDGAFVKRLTGGDAVTTRGIREAQITWQPQCVVFVASNDPLRFQSTDTALLNRVKLLTFPNRHWAREEKPDAKYIRDPELEAKLRAEDSGILSWIMQGMMEFFRRNREIVPPAAAEANKETMRVAGSVTQRWLSEMVEEGYIVKVPEAQREAYKRVDFVRRADTWLCFQAWCEGAKERPLTKGRFFGDLKTEFAIVPTANGPSWEGLLATDKWVNAVNFQTGWAVFR